MPMNDLAFERRLERELAHTDGPPAGWQARVRFRLVQSPVQRMRPKRSLLGPAMALGLVLAFVLGFALAHFRRRPAPMPASASPPPTAFSSYVEDAVYRCEAERDLAETPAELERLQSEVKQLRKLRHDLNPKRPYIEEFPETTDPMEGIPTPRTDPGFEKY